MTNASIPNGWRAFVLKVVLWETPPTSLKEGWVDCIIDLARTAFKPDKVILSVNLSGLLYEEYLAAGGTNLHPHMSGPESRI